MGKDGSGIGAAVVSTPSLLSFPCIDAKPFIVTLVVLSLVLAVWQLQPYEPHPSSSPHPAPSTTTTPLPTPAPSKRLHLPASQRSPSPPSLHLPPFQRLPWRYEKLVALEEAPGSFNEARFHPPYKYEYVYCGSSLYGNLSSSRIREWMAYHAHFFGPKSHFVFHDANWTFYFDVDEYVYLPDGRTLEEVLGGLSEYTQFTIEQNPMSSTLCVRDPSKDYSREWGFEKLVFRNSITGVRRDRKYAIQAKNAYATGVHMSENVIGPTTHKTESMIKYYHYHNSINVLGEPCREFIQMPSKGNLTWHQKIPYVYDENMKRLAEKIKQFELKTIGDLYKK